MSALAPPCASAEFASMRHIHLDPLGGIAGDMFVAAMADALPEAREALVAVAGALAQVSCQVVPYSDGILSGSRFTVDAPNGSAPAGAAVAEAGGHHHHDHGARGSHPGQSEGEHTAWATIRDRIEGSDLPPAVRRHAVGIFAGLAAAEARVHGVAPENVTFHEVGAADSVADIVAAACAIAAVEPATWSVAPLPLGGGLVRTAHGPMPVPAPATALLLEGLVTHDDGIGGERVTPTGAAILRYLAPGARRGGRLARSGTGFGTRRLPGLSNCLRVLVFEDDATEATAEATATPHRELAVVSFEVDDQSGEDLATGLERVRATDGVHDVVQMPAFGKKSRLAVHVQVLARPDALEAAVAACFRETTTIGLRTHRVEGRALARHFAEVAVAGQPVRVKVVERPGGATAKAEADHVLALESHAARASLRRDAEQMAIERAAPSQTEDT